MSNSPKNLPQEWVGMYEGRKRDAMYYERCIKRIREKTRLAIESLPNTAVGAQLDVLLSNYVDTFNDILLHEYTVKDVDLDKPNYGMF